MTIDLRPYRSPAHQPFDLGSAPQQALLVHGFPGTPAEVRPVAEYLAAHGWRAKAPLLPGFGPDIANLERYNRFDWQREVERAWLDMVERGESTGYNALIGFSMGGALALSLASRLKPDRLVLIAPFTRFPRLLTWLALLARRLSKRYYPFRKADFSDPRLRQQLSRFLPDVNLDDPEVQSVIRTQFALPMNVVAELIHQGEEAWRSAPHTKTHTLIIQGTQDQLVQPAQTQKLVRRFSTGLVTYREVEAGHDLLDDHNPVWRTVAHLIVEYLAPQSGSWQESYRRRQAAGVARSEASATQPGM